LPSLYTLVENKFYCDEIALFLVKQVQDTLAQVLNLIEQHLLIGVGVYGVAALFRKVGGVLRYYQTGSVRSYASLLLFGTLLVLFLVIYSGSTMTGFGG
jgi:NADH-quinone oxidoreductase subunit L